MDETKVDKKSVVIKLLFLLIGAGLFLILFNFSTEINYNDPLTIIKLIGFAGYLLLGEKVMRKLFIKGESK